VHPGRSRCRRPCMRGNVQAVSVWSQPVFHGLKLPAKGQGPAKRASMHVPTHLMPPDTESLCSSPWVSMRLAARVAVTSPITSTTCWEAARRRGAVVSCQQNGYLTNAGPHPGCWLRGAGWSLSMSTCSGKAVGITPGAGRLAGAGQAQAAAHSQGRGSR
jgi:hypothetical protein